MDCHQCGREVALEGKVQRKDTCPACHSFLHCCRNCDFHDPGAHNQCREPAAEWVSSKESANFCEFFRPAGGQGGGPGPDRTARDAFDDLFRR